jgi:hypothetical protein
MGVAMAVVGRVPPRPGEGRLGRMAAAQRCWSLRSKFSALRARKPQHLRSRVRASQRQRFRSTVSVQHPAHHRLAWRLAEAAAAIAIDGRLIDPWQITAVLEGLPLCLDGALPVIERLEILDAARHALAPHERLVAPDFDEEGVVRQAERHLVGSLATGETPLLVAASGMPAWLAADGARPPIRAALVRFWGRHGVLRLPVPLTGAAAVRAKTSPARPVGRLTRWCAATGSQPGGNISRWVLPKRYRNAARR